jgi:chromate reductase
VARILIIAASTGKNLDLALKFKQSLEEKGHEGVVTDLCALNIPMYTPAAEKELTELTSIVGVMEHILSSDAMIVCAPEYNGSTPPVLSNLIAWLSVQSKNFRMLFNQRNVGLASVSGGGGQHAVMGMRMQFSYLVSKVLGRPVIINKSNPFKQSSIDVLIQQVVQ